jgi:hypothetical protein
MARQDITIDTTDLNRIARGLSHFQSEIPKATAAALNRTVDFIYTKAAQVISSEYEIKSTDVKKSSKKIKANNGNMRAGLIYSGNSLSLTNFKFTPKKRGTKKQVKVKIKRSEGYKNVGPKSFVQIINGKTGIWAREMNRRYPIKLLKTISIPQMVINANVNNKIQDEAQNKLLQRMDHEIEYRLNRLRRP